MDKVGQPGWPVIRPREQQDRFAVNARWSVAGGRIMGLPFTGLSPHRRLISLHWQKYNKSLHPIRPLVPAFACCSFGAANAGPMVRTGELNRYIFCRWPHSTQGRPIHQEPWRESVAGPSRATRWIMTSDGRPTLMPPFYGWMLASN